MLDKILAVVAAITLSLVIGLIGYNEFNTTNVTVMVNLQNTEDPLRTLYRIIPADSTVREVREIDRSTKQYEIEVVTRRRQQGLLDWIKLSDKVKKAEIKE